MEHYYLLRSRQNGDYVAARMAAQPQEEKRLDEREQRYLLLFRADHEAFLYLNTHAGDVSKHFAVEMSSLRQIKLTLERLGFTGVGFVSDALLPQVDFMESRLL
ncbi:MAG: hypothetical protein HC857_11225 [Synechococcales cyanobacterium RU_4_20]|nr:hypothetical protein [Synechococcales cyanobacterium RU_4_20]NJR69084.1 hypothetical protein [Synechococcales cyanobacterium CRU_2_2]